MTVAIVDGDIVAYRCAASAEKDEESIAFIRASRLLQDIISDTDSDEIKLYISGSTNFRYNIYPEYKANRKDLPRPKHLQRVREFLILKWGAEVTDGIEADDAIGIQATTLLNEGRNRGVVCSIDKDLLQLAGDHFNFVTGTFSTVSEAGGWRNFYSQLVLGDKADNIPGFDGKARIKWPKFLMPYRDQLLKEETARGMHSVVRHLYGSINEDKLIRNARVLYIWRKQNDEWLVPTQVETTLEVKQETEAKSASTVMTPGENILSTEPITTKRNKGGSLPAGRAKGSPQTKKRRGA